MNRNSIEVRVGTENEFSKVCDTLADAFFEDPFVEYMFPDKSRRARFLPVYFSIYAESGHTLIAGDDFDWYVGAAVHFTPENLDLSEEKLRHDAEKVFSLCGDDAHTVVAMMKALNENHPRDLVHAYLLFIGSRLARGSGVATALVDHLAQRWDAENLPMYGAATTLKNLNFSVDHMDARPLEPRIRLDNGLELFPLLRLPQSRRASQAS
ncbi:hypothetical protein [Ciceribacter sp. RN22]|uniref:hypothetical protein n=1 Tax=Ciceribacter sp. RN22 TaxID=2954932 RepID=UPI00209248F3|nr:hypothetical protein [Ciceribacter sp. RN22]MCO6181136.1 hypothetical protein [Ciceribacter sp. RN22]